MKVLLLGLVAFLPAIAQTGAYPPPLPSNWVGAGAGYNPSGSPIATGWMSVAVLLNQSSKVYSYSSYDAIPQKNAVPVMSARTGFATVLRNFGPQLFLLGFGTAGIAQSATAVQGSFSGGGMLVYQFKNGWTGEGGMRIASGTADKIIEFGFGRSFK